MKVENLAIVLYFSEYSRTHKERSDHEKSG
jgi:hypothetical protein